MAKRLLPYINRFTGEVQILTKTQGARLNEDWSRAKPVLNEKGEKVFRFEIATELIGKDGKKHPGVAVVDISEVRANGNPESK